MEAFLCWGKGKCAPNLSTIMWLPLFRSRFLDPHSHEDSDLGLAKPYCAENPHISTKLWFSIPDTISDALGNFYIHNIQKIHNFQPVLDSCRQLKNTQNFQAKFGWPILKSSSIVFFFTAQANVPVNSFIAYFYYSKLLAWC